MNKDFIFLILLLIVVFGVLFWQNPETIDFYFDKVKAVMAPKLKLSEDSGLDLSNVDISAFVSDEALVNKEEESVFVLDEITLNEEQIENGIGGPLIGEMLEEQVVEKEVVVFEKKLSMQEIEQEINRVAKEVERIDKEIQILVALSRTQ